MSNLNESATLTTIHRIKSHNCGTTNVKIVKNYTDHPTIFPNNVMSIEQNVVKLIWRSELTHGVICCITTILICLKRTILCGITSPNYSTIKVKIFTRKKNTI